MIFFKHGATSISDLKKKLNLIFSQSKFLRECFNLFSQGMQLQLPPCPPPHLYLCVRFKFSMAVLICFLNFYVMSIFQLPLASIQCITIYMECRLFDGNALFIYFNTLWLNGTYKLFFGNKKAVFIYFDKSISQLLIEFLKEKPLRFIPGTI